MNPIFAFLVTLSSALTALADTQPTSCITSLNRKTVQFQFKGGEYNIWNLINSPYKATLEFDANSRGGEVKYTTNWGLDNTLTISPITKEIIRETPYARHDQEFGEHNVILLKCFDQGYRKGCEGTAKKIFDELILIRSRSLETLTEAEKKEQDDAIECVFETLQRTVL